VLGFLHHVGVLTAILTCACLSLSAAEPAPDAPLPTGPVTLARRMRSTDVALSDAVGRWVREGDPSRGGPPEDVELLALDEQRALRLLARRPRLAARVVPRLPAAQRRHAREILTAMGQLRRLTPPSKRSNLRIGPALPADRLLREYRGAQRRFGVGWHVLAAVNFVESAFGRLRNDSVAGAQGPMQFIPSTWAAFGMGGDVRDPHDAILGAANYLRSSGAPGNYRRALFAYNPSSLYVNSVRAYARRMARSPRAFYRFYSWQVFVRTTDGGERRLSGPGLRR
jgi:membrane-bound lytic murein transglycosylase B